jgi:hypothetical protein
VCASSCRAVLVTVGVGVAFGNMRRANGRVGKESVGSQDGINSRHAERLSRTAALGRCCRKSILGGNKQDFLKLLMGFVRSDVRDHIASQKDDHGPSYRHYRASQRDSLRVRRRRSAPLERTPAKWKDLPSRRIS